MAGEYFPLVRESAHVRATISRTEAVAELFDIADTEGSRPAISPEAQGPGHLVVVDLAPDELGPLHYLLWIYEGAFGVWYVFHPRLPGVAWPLTPYTDPGLPGVPPEA